MNDMRAVNLTIEDIEANKQGLLSSAQMQALYRRRRIFLAGTFLFVLITAGLFILLFLGRSDPMFAARGELFFWIPISLFWLWLLRLAPLKFIRINFDLNSGKVSQVEGRAQLQWKNSFGLIQFPQYEVQMADEVFSLSREEYFQFKHLDYYLIYYAPRSKVFLGALPLPEPQGSAAEQAPSPEPAEDPANLLNQHEREVLNLMASGLSNKEIAERLSLPVNTIKMYASQIYQKMGVSRRTEAIAQAHKLGIL